MNKIISSIITFFIIILPFLIYYEISFFEIELMTVIILFLFLLEFLFFFFFKNKKIDKNMKRLFFYFFVLILISLFDFIFFEYSFNQFKNISYLNSYVFFILRMMVFFLGVYLFFDFKKGIKIYVFFSYLIVIIFMVQVITYYIFKIPLEFNIIFLQLQDKYEMAFKRLSINYIFPRFSSLFSEPAHFSQYIIPFFIFKLFGYKNIVKKSTVVALILSLEIILSTSGNGIIIISLVWGIYFILNLKYISTKKLIIYLLVIISFLLLIYLFSDAPFFNYVLGRLFKEDPFTQYHPIGFRVFRGFLVFRDLPIIHKLLGVGYYNELTARNYYNLKDNIYDMPGGYDWMNHFSQILVYFGIFAFFMYVFLLYSLYKRQETITIKILIFSFILLNLTTAMMIDSVWMLYMFLIYSGLILEKENKYNKELF
jgi:hypothetical protein